MVVCVLDKPKESLVKVKQAFQLGWLDKISIETAFSLLYGVFHAKR